MNKRNIALAKYHITELDTKGKTETLLVPEEEEDGYEYVDEERMVKQRI